jgi:hypothetical protein
MWLTLVLDELAQLYVTVSSQERDRIAIGIEALNRQLATDPYAIGESRDGDQRVAFPDLLAVSYRIDRGMKIVRVTGVARFGR